MDGRVILLGIGRIISEGSHPFHDRVVLGGEGAMVLVRTTANEYWRPHAARL